jgi:hypothetical protein
MPSADTRVMARKPRRLPRPRRTAKPKAKSPPKKGTPAKPAPKAAKPPPPKAKVVPTVRPVREEFEEETVCSIEFLQDNRSFIARLDTNRGGMREHRAPSFTDLLELVAEDLREEFLEV